MSGYQKIASITLYVLAAISIIAVLFYYFGGVVPETVGTTFEEMKFTNEFLIWATILFAVAAVSTLLFSFYNIFTNPKALKGFAISLASAGVLILIAYLISSDASLTHVLPENFNPTASTLKWVGTGLNATYILAALAFFGIVISEIMSFVR